MSRGKYLAREGPGSRLSERLRARRLRSAAESINSSCHILELQCADRCANDAFLTSFSSYLKRMLWWSADCKTSDVTKTERAELAPQTKSVRSANSQRLALKQQKFALRSRKTSGALSRIALGMADHSAPELRSESTVQTFCCSQATSGQSCSFWTFECGFQSEWRAAYAMSCKTRKAVRHAESESATLWFYTFFLQMWTNIAVHKAFCMPKAVGFSPQLAMTTHTHTVSRHFQAPVVYLFAKMKLRPYAHMSVLRKFYPSAAFMHDFTGKGLPGKPLSSQMAGQQQDRMPREVLFGRVCHFDLSKRLQRHPVCFEV